MSIINRFLLLLLSLMGLALSFAVLAAAMQVLPENVWLKQLHFVLAQKETYIVCLVMVLICVKLFLAVFSRKPSTPSTSKGEYVIDAGPQGEVRVSLEAMRSLADRMAREVHGVRDAKVRIKAHNPKEGEASLSLDVDLSVGREAEVSVVAKTLTNRVQEHFRRTMALTDVPVNVMVSEVSDAEPEKKHRVV
ncbi:MAG: alkaline shock response membrane anchor protein AmaP [Selenomonas sp.]|uniref:alkaline shock response membrane anchor protein AmaP n=1 Tax=Selenomonas sp. TaxID=2053611 RepID=UPI0025D298D4|nr:alkaline shock response membrane anchor protein AmaP [Selenomonas sp.]MCR5757724.1 alkaline shock response membrane anchor protein AmaP [Selenomonas sp.]